MAVSVSEIPTGLHINPAFGIYRGGDDNPTIRQFMMAYRREIEVIQLVGHLPLDVSAFFAPVLNT